MMNTQSWFRVHSFTGIVTGLMLFLICWTGTFAVISYELDWLVTPQLRIQATDNAQINWPKIIDEVNKDHSAHTLFVAAPPYEAAPISAILNTKQQGAKQRLFHPHTAEIIDDISAFNIQRFFRDLHRRIFYPNPWGLYLVCFFALTLLTSLIAALYFYKRWWQRFFQIRFSDMKSFLSAAHKLSGLWSIWFIVVISGTSIWYIFESVRYQFGDGVISYASYTEETAPNFIPKRKTSSTEQLATGKAITEKINTVFPDLQLRSFRPNDGGYFYADGQTGNILLRDGANEIWLRPDTLGVAYQQQAETLSAYWIWSDMADPLHFGNFGGIYSKIVWFVFGLALSFMILTGTYLHAKRLQKGGKKKLKYNWRLTNFATGLTLLIWLSSIPLAFTRVTQYAGSTNDVPALEPGVAVFIFGWSVLTLMIVILWNRLLIKS